MPTVVADVTISSLITDLSSVATGIWSQISTVAETITTTPILLLTVGFLFVGGVVGIFGRLLSRG